MFAPTASGRGKKLYHHSLGSLTTIDVLECVSDSGSEGDTFTEDGTLSNPRSDLPEPSETLNPEAELDGTDSGSDSDSKVLANLGFIDGVTTGPLLPWNENVEASIGEDGITPPAYPDLFWRRFMAAARVPRKLSSDCLAEHNAAQGRRGATAKEELTSTAGDWLGSFKAEARMVPLKHLAGSVLGDDVGDGLAAFVRAEDIGHALSEHCASSMGASDVGYGGRVVGSKFRTLPVSVTHGRRGFIKEDEVSISTPDRSIDGPSGPASECSDDWGHDIPVWTSGPDTGAVTAFSGFL